MSFIYYSCNENPIKPETPSFDDLFYHSYRGYAAYFGNTSEYPEIKIFHCNTYSFFEIKPNGIINLRICGCITETSDSVDFQTSGDIEILNKYTYLKMV